MKKAFLACTLCVSIVLGTFAIAYAAKSQAAFGKDAEKRYISDVEFLVNTDTGGLDDSSIAGRNTVINFLKDKCEKLGATTFIRVEEKTQVPHLVCELKGNNKNGKNVVLMSHYDTVMRPKNDFKFAYNEKTGIMTGPAVGDSKTSVAQMIYVLEALKNVKGMPFNTVRVWFDGAEDGPGGGDTRKTLQNELTEWADVTLITDSGRPSYGVATKRKGQADCSVKITGIQGHSGNSPHVAASATMELGQVLNQLHQISQKLESIRIPKAPGMGSGKGSESYGPGGAGHDPAKYTPDALKARGELDTGQYINDCSINAGIIKTSNTAKNVIPGDAEANLNIRCYSQQTYDELKKELFAIKPTIMGTEVAISCPEKLGPTYDGYDKTPKGKFNITNTQVLDSYRNIMKDNFKIEVTEWMAGGGTIANYTNATRPTLDALGVDADPTIEHGPKEWVDIKTVKPRVVGLAELILQIDKM